MSTIILREESIKMNCEEHKLHSCVEAQKFLKN